MPCFRFCLFFNQMGATEESRSWKVLFLQKSLHQCSSLWRKILGSGLLIGSRYELKVQKTIFTECSNWMSEVREKDG